MGYCGPLPLKFLELGAGHDRIGEKTAGAAGFRGFGQLGGAHRPDCLPDIPQSDIVPS